VGYLERLLSTVLISLVGIELIYRALMADLLREHFAAGGREASTWLADAAGVLCSSIW